MARNRRNARGSRITTARAASLDPARQPPPVPTKLPTRTNSRYTRVPGVAFLGGIVGGAVGDAVDGDHQLRHDDDRGRRTGNRQTFVS